jgi:hypothetical protein
VNHDEVEEARACEDQEHGQDEPLPFYPDYVLHLVSCTVYRADVAGTIVRSPMVRHLSRKRGQRAIDALKGVVRVQSLNSDGRVIVRLTKPRFCHCPS